MGEVEHYFGRMSIGINNIDTNLLSRMLDKCPKEEFLSAKGAFLCQVCKILPNNVLEIIKILHEHDKTLENRN